MSEHCQQITNRRKSTDSEYSDISDNVSMDKNSADDMTKDFAQIALQELNEYYSAIHLGDDVFDNGVLETIKSALWKGQIMYNSETKSLLVQIFSHCEDMITRPVCVSDLDIISGISRCHSDKLKFHLASIDALERESQHLTKEATPGSWTDILKHGDVYRFMKLDFAIFLMKRILSGHLLIYEYIVSQYPNFVAEDGERFLDDDWTKHKMEYDSIVSYMREKFPLRDAYFKTGHIYNLIGHVPSSGMLKYARSLGYRFDQPLEELVDGFVDHNTVAFFISNGAIIDSRTCISLKMRQYDFSKQCTLTGFGPFAGITSALWILCKTGRCKCLNPEENHPEIMQMNNKRKKLVK